MQTTEVVGKCFR